MTMMMTSTKERKTLQCRARQTSAKKTQMDKPKMMPPLPRKSKRNYSHTWRRSKTIRQKAHKKTMRARTKRKSKKIKTSRMLPIKATTRRHLRMTMKAKPINKRTNK